MRPANSSARRLTIASATLLLGAAGCGASSELETATVNGLVTLDGEPLQSGYVMVLPVRGRMARGTIQEDGSFVLGSYSDSDGAQIGDHPVVVTPVPADEGVSRPRSEQRIPRRYRRAGSSGLRVTVEPGGLDDWLIELSTAE